MTDGQIAFTIGKLKEYGLLESGEALEKGIGCMTDEHIADFYKKMVDAGVVKDGLDIKGPTPPSTSARASAWTSRRAEPRPPGAVPPARPRADIMTGNCSRRLRPH